MSRLYRVRVRTLIVAAVAVLVELLLVGGGALALVEGIGYGDGVWLAFAVITTIGFGSAPSTWGGTVLSIALFALAAVQRFGILVAAVDQAASLRDEFS